MLEERDGLALLAYDLFECDRDQVSFRLGILASLHLKVETKILEHIVRNATLLYQLDHELPILDNLALEVILE